MTPFTCDLPAQSFVSGPGVVAELADTVAVIGTLDIVFGEIDR